MRKVLMVGLSSNYGGIEKVIYNISKNIDKMQYSLSFLNIGTEKLAYHEKFIENGFNIFNITPRFKNYKAFLKELKELLITEKFDIIHINLMTFSFFEIFLLTKRYTCSKIIVHSHSGSNYLRQCGVKTKILNFVGQLIAKSDVNIACSEDAGYIFKNKVYTVINNGIDIEEFTFDKNTRKKIRKNLKVDEDEILFGNVGLICKNKNQLKTLKIFNEYYKINSKSKMLFIGRKTEYEELYEYIKNNNLEDRIIFISEINNVNEYYSAMDLFLFNSNSESLGIVLIEAQINGLYVVADKKLYKPCIKISDNMDFIQEGTSAEDLAKILANKSFNRNSKASYNLDVFSIQKMVDSIDKIWSEL